MAWRRQIGADDILDQWEPPEVLQKYYTGGFVGYDKEGFPVYLSLVISHLDFTGRRSL